MGRIFRPENFVFGQVKIVMMMMLVVVMVLVVVVVMMMIDGGELRDFSKTLL